MYTMPGVQGKEKFIGAVVHFYDEYGGNYRHVVVNTVSPKVGRGKLPPNYLRTSEYKSLTRSHANARSMVQW